MTVACLAAVIGGSVYAYSLYAKDTAQLAKVQQIYDYAMMNGEAAKPEMSVAKTPIPPFPLEP